AKLGVQSKIDAVAAAREMNIIECAAGACAKRAASSLELLDNATLARASMGTSLGFHVVFAVLGVGMPLLMATAEGIGLWRRDAAWIALARRWSSAFGVLFAIGAVSGTVLSFELVLLW